ncbi:MAG: 7-cyano-7-deazaguanine synthase QueC [Gammaproteobacteria bacterium]|nr:7-cyano-7-deazaguanine synthase QueC [Gammaproteobacteria bacterium]MDH3409945.1 7-cyano-7-deazaguanine synthase QueC [Gammaproteobacteria bacterium]MDH3553859.1 7-cyano-7-deazaguanine synthase QueC [Gammaproteobacteria bacterium]
MTVTGDKALVLLSGGQDSTTCLYWAIERFGRQAVTAISFDYGQRHRIELDCAATIADKAGVSYVCLPINTFAALGGDALTDTGVDVRGDLDTETGLPNTFVPGRNLIFLSFAAAYAYQRRIRHLVTGVAQTDYSGYPDCRSQTIESMQETLRLGMESDVRVHTPLMHKSKKETVELARELGALDAMADTHTCYNGVRPPCGECPACLLRAKGFAEAGVEDPLIRTV